MVVSHLSITMRYWRDLKLTAEWLNKVCYDVATEPPLQPLSGEAIVSMTANRQDEARADIHARHMQKWAVTCKSLNVYGGLMSNYTTKIVTPSSLSGF